MPTRQVPLGHVLLFWGIALGGMAFDLISKTLIFAQVPFGATRTVIPGMLELHPSHNKGALWGWGSSIPFSGYLFAALSVLAGLGICWYLFLKKAAVDARLTAALALIMAGALGNCFDRLVYGYVRDFAHFHIDRIHFECAIFNFADNMLVAGSIFLMVLALRPEPSTETTEPAPPTEAAVSK